MHQDERIEAIHNAGRPLVLAVTGGGTSALGELLRVPGGSRSVLEGVVPYSAAALAEWLGGPPEAACSARTARGMAMAAWQRARRLAPAEIPSAALLGLGCTASLASARPKRGDHRFYLAAQSRDMTVCRGWKLAKGARTRDEEERLVCDVALRFLASVCAPDLSLELDASAGLEPIADESARGGPELAALLAGELAAVRLTVEESATPTVLATLPRGAALREPERPRLLFPGAFNPLHAGHRRMAALAEQRCGGAVELELSIQNVDKPLLDYVELARRWDWFTPGARIWLTRAPTFVEKSALFPGATFVVGADTIERIAAARYYGGDEGARDAALARLAASDCRFLVFGRLTDGAFHTLEDLELPAALRALCTAVPESDFRADICSTALRSQTRDDD